ncbi:unnamed protein product [Ilex paraguariensis]|uniref:F-box domain-containing protein n=1 Tax=Ilex paraguariensis TaxID=185542 RepID=A0ABC8SV10_9AQUA
MGAGFSDFGRESIEAPSKPGLGEIPESCVALILTCLDAPEICRLAVLNRVFHRASSADFVWESKLPENYRVLVKKLLDESPESLAKKELYAKLCRPNRFDGGSKEVWLEKGRGGLCVSISWKGMKITGIDDRRYWNHIPTDESRFHTVAYLQQIWWLEVDGNLEFEFPAGNYSLFFRLHLGKPSKRLGRPVCNLERVHGWSIKPVRFHLSTSNGQHAISQCYLNEPGRWINHHVGDFFVEDSNIPMKIKFSMTQIDCTHTKGGLCLDSVFIYPIAYLQQIWWLEVDGNLEFEFPAGNYSLFFRLHLGKPSKRLGRPVCNLERVHGWSIKPVRFHLSTSNGQHAISQCYLNEPGRWINHHVGDFFVEDSNIPMKIKFSMTQIDCTHTKGGLCLDSVFIYPSEFGERLKQFSICR